MGSKAHNSRAAKPLALCVAGCFVLSAASCLAGEKIEIDKTPKLNFQKQRTIDDISPSFKADVTKPDLEGTSVLTPPQNKPSSRAMERALQEMIDRKQNWLFYGPGDELSSDQDIISRNKVESQWDFDPKFRPKSERFMTGDEQGGRNGSRDKEDEDSDSNSENSNRLNQRDNRRDSVRDDEDRDTDDNKVMQEFNIHPYLHPDRVAEERTLNGTGFLKQNQYTFKPTGADLISNSSSEKDSIKESEKRRAAQFKTLLEGTGVSSGAKTSDPLAKFGPDPTRQEVNPAAPGRFDFDANNGSSSSAVLTRPSTASSFSIPTPSAIDGINARMSRTPFSGESSLMPAPSATAAAKPAPFHLEIPKRKF